MYPSASGKACAKVFRWFPPLALLFLPWAPAAQATSIYLANQSTGIVSAYDQASGAFQGQAGRFGSPAALATDGLSLFVSDWTTNTVYRLDPASPGNPIPFLALPSGSGPIQLAFDGRGNSYVTTLLTGMVYKFDPAGALLTSVSIPRARGIAYDPANGNLYVVSTASDTIRGAVDSIVKLTTGLSVSTFLTAGLAAPRFIIFDQAGDFAISNSGNGPNGGFVTAYTPAGTAAGTLSGLHAPSQMVYTTGAVPLYIAEYGSDDVLRCSASSGCSVFIRQGSGLLGQGTLGLTVGPSFAPAHTPEPAAFILTVIGLGTLALTYARRGRPGR